MKRKHLQLLYIIVGLLDILSIQFYEPCRVITKPSLMIILIIYYFLFSVNFNIQFFLALFFALLGDIFLLGEGFTWFICGLAAFMIMQILYAIVFYKNRNPLSVQDVAGTIILLIYGLVLIFALWPHLSQVLKLPVILYSVAIITMGFFALIRKKSNITYIPVLTGSIFFIASDSLLAFNEFTNMINHAGIAVMITYIIAQFLIVTGITEE